MEFERQKRITENYRENWERIFKREADRAAEAARICYPNGCPILSEENQNA